MKDPQRLKHKVRFNIEFDYKEEDSHKSKPLIVFVQAGSISEKKFSPGDLIKSINNIKVKTGDDLDNEINKLNWGDEVLFEVERNNKIEKVNIKTISFNHYKENCVTWSLEIEKVNKLIKIKRYGIDYTFDNELEVGDELISINSEKLLSLEDFDKERSKYKVGDIIEYKIQRQNQPKPKIIKIKLISFKDSVKNNKKSCENFYHKKVGSLMFKEWEESDYGRNHKDWNKRRDEILQLETIAERFSDPADLIRKWKNKDAKLINKLVKPKYKDINFKLNFYSLIFNTKIIEKLKNLSIKMPDGEPFHLNQCCYSYILTEKTQGGDWNKKVPENISNFERLVSVKDKKKELLFDKISEQTKNFFFNLMVDKKKKIKIKYISKKKNKSEKKSAILRTDFNCEVFENINDLLYFWFEDKYKFNKAKIKLAISEWCKSFFLEYPEFTHKRIEEINSMDLVDIDPDEYDYSDEEYNYKSPEDEEIKIKTSVHKKKINGKNSFLIKFENLPDDLLIQQYNDEGKKIYLKVYAYDVSDLNNEKYYEARDSEQYFINNSQVIKTDNFTWSEGDEVLVQNKELKPYEDFSGALAIPFSVMVFPKYGNRKVSFRTFICTDNQKFDESTGRPILNETQNFAAEELFLLDYRNEFDEDNEFSDILSYHNTEIDSKYNQPGYLEINLRKLNDIKISLAFCLLNDGSKDYLNRLEKIKKNIKYGDFTVEGNIYKTLNLKKNYEIALSNKFNIDEIFRELKKNSVIHERYEIINYLLNIAIDDETFNEKENNFIDSVANNLDLNQEKYQEIKKQKTASVKFVDFGINAGESIFGLNKNMSNKEKEKVLRKEYSRWNALTNNSDKSIRERAREMRDLAAKLRSELSN